MIRIGEIFVSRLNKPRLVASHLEIDVSMSGDQQEEKLVEMENIPEPKTDQILSYSIIIMIRYMEKNFHHSTGYSQSCSGHPGEEGPR